MDGDIFSDRKAIDEEQDAQTRKLLLLTAKDKGTVDRDDVEAYVRDCMEQRKTFLQLPFTLLYFGTFVWMVLSHEHMTQSGQLQRTLRSMLSGTTFEGVAFTSGHKDMGDIATKEDVYTFLYEALLPLFINDLSVVPPEDKYRVLRNNQLIGGVLLQQLRREKVLCSTEYPHLGPFPSNGDSNPIFSTSNGIANPILASFFCYPWYKGSEACFGPDDRSLHNGATGWCPSTQLTEEPALQNGSARRLDFVPDGGGTGGSQKGAWANPGPEQYFNVHLHEYEGLDVALKKVKALQDNGWIDFHTSWVGIRMFVLNPDLAIFAHVTVNIYFPPSGMLIPHITAQSFSPEPYQYMSIVLIDVFWVVLLLWFCLRTFVDFITAVRSNKLLKWVKRIWTWIDLVSVFGGFGTILLMLTLLDMLQGVKEQAMSVRMGEPGGTVGLAASTAGNQTNSEADYRKLVSAFHVDLIEISEYLMIMRLLLCWYTLISATKFLQAFEAQPRLSVLTSTLLRGSSDFLHFFIVWLVIFMAFVVTGVFIFGRRMWDFSNATNAFLSCFRAMLGDYDWWKLIEEHPTTGALWFWMFNVLVVMLALNILMAIIMDTYSEIKGEAESSRKVWDQVYDLVKDLYNRKTGKASSNDQILESIVAMKAEGIDDVDANLLRQYVGSKLSHDQATELIKATRDRGDAETSRGISMSEAMRMIGWVKVKMHKMEWKLEEILESELAENETALRRQSESSHPTGEEAGDESHFVSEGDSRARKEAMTVLEGKERLDSLDMRMAKMEAFLGEAQKYADFRGTDVRNRLVVIEDLLRSNRDAAVLRAERKVWQNLPPRLGAHDANNSRSAHYL